MASMGKVFFPKHATWKADVMGQLLRFPAGKHDDSVDVCSLIGRGLQFIGQGRRKRQDKPSDARNSSGGWMAA